MQAGTAENPVALTITQKYGNEDIFIEMMEQIGVPASARRKLVDDDFDSMQSLVLNYSKRRGFFRYLPQRTQQDFWGRQQNQCSLIQSCSD